MKSNQKELDQHIAGAVFNVFVEKVQGGSWCIERFDYEMRGYIEVLLDKGLDPLEIQMAMRQAGIDAELHVTIIEEGEEEEHGE